MSQGLEALRVAYPWPADRPNRREVHWSLDAGGRNLITRLIRNREFSVVLEIGAFLGGSIKTWLAATPAVSVVAVDPWPGGSWLDEFARQHRQPEWVVRQLASNAEALYETFVANMWDDRRRVIPVRGSALEVLPTLAQLGLRPDLIFLDADKTGRELEVCRSLFPQAMLAGDDWFMGSDRFWRVDEGYPIRRPVREFCRKHGGHLKVDKQTWVIDDEPPSLAYMSTLARYHFKSLRRRLRGLWLGSRVEG